MCQLCEDVIGEIRDKFSDENLVRNRRNCINICPTLVYINYLVTICIGMESVLLMNHVTILFRIQWRYIWSPFVSCAQTLK